MTPDISMYESAMGEHFMRLAAPVQQFHRLNGRHVLHGQVEVHASGSMLARPLGTPLIACEGPIKFELNAHPLVETWTRYFPSNVLTSTLQLDGNYLVEKVGAARLTFELSASDGHLHMHLRQLQFFGIVCPKWLMPIIVAEESESMIACIFTSAHRCAISVWSRDIIATCYFPKHSPAEAAHDRRIRCKVFAVQQLCAFSAAP
jgi:Domain of unknown function (DUF4166)